MYLVLFILVASIISKLRDMYRHVSSWYSMQIQQKRININLSKASYVYSNNVNDYKIAASNQDAKQNSYYCMKTKKKIHKCNSTTALGSWNITVMLPENQLAADRAGSHVTLVSGNISS